MTLKVFICGTTLLHSLFGLGNELSCRLSLEANVPNKEICKKLGEQFTYGKTGYYLCEETKNDQ